MLSGGFSVIIPGGLSVIWVMKCYQGDLMLPGRFSVTRGIKCNHTREIKCYQGDLM